jgi:hypothetical protein
MIDIAELIARMRQTFQVTGDKWFGLAADRLAAQAQEIERLQEIVGKEEEWCDAADLKRRAEAAEARVRELEEQNYGYRHAIEKLKAAVRTIEVATIEQCAKVASNWNGDFDYPYGQERVATAIRALIK